MGGEGEAAHQGLATPSAQEGTGAGHQSRPMTKGTGTAKRGGKCGPGGWRKNSQQAQEVGEGARSAHSSPSAGARGDTQASDGDTEMGSPVPSRGDGPLTPKVRSRRSSLRMSEEMEFSPGQSPSRLNKRAWEKGQEDGMGEPGGSRGSCIPSEDGGGKRKKEEEEPLGNRRCDGSVEKRGRKALTPENRGQHTFEKREEKKRQVKERKAKEALVFVEDTRYKAKSKRAETADRNVLVKMVEMKKAPTASITQLGIDAVEQIKKVAATASNLHGGQVGALWRAAENLAALNLVLTRRAQEEKEEDGERRASELDSLRMEISVLRANEALLQGQVRKLREVARGDAHETPPQQAGGEGKPLSRGRGKGMRTRLADSSDSSEEDNQMDVGERDLSPASRKAGERAREEVQRDLAEGTTPPAIRPSVQGKRKVLEGCGIPPAARKAAEVLPPPRKERPVTPVPEKRGLGGDWTLEGVVQAVVETLIASGLISAPSSVPPKGAITATKRGEPRREERERRDPPPPPATQVVAGEEGASPKGKKKRKRNNKGRKGNAGAKAPASAESAPRGKKGAPPPASQGVAAGGGTAQPRSSPLVESWAEVAKKGGKKAAGAASGGDQAPLPRNAPQPAKGKGVGAPLPRGPRGAAVTLTCPEGRYAEVLREARGAIKLQELGISGIRSRRAVTGALVLEIPGQEGAGKAEALRKRMADLFAGREEIKVSRPVKRSELRLRDLDDSATAEDVGMAVAEAGGCTRDDVLVGPIKKGPNGLGTVWARCPLTAARKVVAGGRLTVGWTAARVEALAVRPFQCFRCLKEGHARAQCPSEVDRSGMCYRCGSTGHRAAQCAEKARCPVCRDANLPSDHRLGGKACKGVKAGAGRKKATMPPPNRPKAGMEEGVGTSGGTSKVPPKEGGEDTSPKEKRVERRRQRVERGVEEASTPMEVSLEETGGQ